MISSEFIGLVYFNLRKQQGILNLEIASVKKQ